MLTDKIWWGTIAKSLIFLPLAISFVGASVIWKFIYEYRGEGQVQIGLLNAIVQFFGGNPQVWISLPFWNNFFLMAILIWIQTGFAMVILSAALRGIPEETIEAAVIDGAGPFQIFWKIMIPQIWGTIAVVWTTITILVLKVFDIVLTMTNGQWNSQVLANLDVRLDVPRRRRLRPRRDDRDHHHARRAADHDLEHPPGQQRDGRALRWRRLAASRPANPSSATSASTSPCCSSSSIWTIPTLGILVSSLRDKDQIIASGWWNSFSSSTPDRSRPPAGRPPARSRRTARFVIEGNIFGDQPPREISAFGVRVGSSDPIQGGRTPPTSATASTLQLNADGAFVLSSPVAFEGDRGQRVYYALLGAAALHHRELRDGAVFGRHRALLHQLADGDGAGDRHPDHDRGLRGLRARLDALSRRALLIIAVIIGLLVVPLQMSLIPLLQALQRRRRSSSACRSKTYLGIWLAHTGFGLPFAIYLLRSYMAGLPRELMESARIDGASDFEIFIKIVLPLSLPGARLLRHLPVPVGVERSAGGDGFPQDRRDAARADREAQRPARFARRRLGDPHDLGLRHHHRAADRVLLAAALFRARPARRFGERRLIRCPHWQRREAQPETRSRTATGGAAR